MLRSCALSALSPQATGRTEGSPQEGRLLLSPDPCPPASPTSKQLTLLAMEVCDATFYQGFPSPPCRHRPCLICSVPGQPVPGSCLPLIIPTPSPVCRSAGPQTPAPARMASLHCAHTTPPDAHRHPHPRGHGVISNSHDQP